LGTLVALHWRNWDDEWVVFDSGSGQTHKVDHLSAAILTLIEAGAITAHELSAQLSQASDLPIPEWRQAIDTVVGQLWELGLIESELQ
jgi:PqqD family protein of HPr-rel-A system